MRAKAKITTKKRVAKRTISSQLDLIFEDAIRKAINSVYNQYQQDHDQERYTKKFYIWHMPLSIYTTIGADNIHHACNKATKMFQGEWSGICEKKLLGYEFKTIKDFNAIIRDYKTNPLTPLR